MKQFFKYVLATITGLVMLMFVFFIVFAGMIASSKRSQTVEIKDNSVLHVKLNYNITDRPHDNALELLAASLSGENMKPVGLYDILTSIEHAKTDDKIKGIFLDVSVLGAGYGKLSEIRDALEDFKESGKFIYAYGEMYYNQSYYFASVADSVILNPSGNMLFNGLAADITFFKQTLEKLGVEMQVIKRGKFKGAVEPYVLDQLSEENRKQISEYVESIYSDFLGKIGGSRNISVDSLRVVANEVRVKTSNDAVANHLVDNLMYRDQVMAMIKERIGSDKENLVSLAKYNQTVNPIGKMEAGDKIAVVYAEGEIVGGNGQSTEVGSDKFAKALRDARNDDKVKAVVLRINSPGGSALASDIIWRETKLLRAKKPLIISMGDVAASGGYYIACMGDSILAMPNSITGSIGVFALYPNAEKLMDNVGLHTEVVKTSDVADFGRIDRPLNANELNILDAMIGQIYEQFLGRVEEGRGLDRAHLDTIAEGRVWTGTYAKNIGLIDEFGGMQDAVRIAAAKAGVSDYSVTSFPKSKSPFEEFFGGGINVSYIKNKWMKEELGVYYPAYAKLKKLSNTSGIQMLMPMEININ